MYDNDGYYYDEEEDTLNNDSSGDDLMSWCSDMPKYSEDLSMPISLESEDVKNSFVNLLTFPKEVKKDLVEESNENLIPFEENPSTLSSNIYENGYDDFHEEYFVSKYTNHHSYVENGPLLIEGEDVRVTPSSIFPLIKRDNRGK